MAIAGSPKTFAARMLLLLMPKHTLTLLHQCLLLSFLQIQTFHSTFEVQQIGGMLAFACDIIGPIRCFINCLHSRFAHFAEIRLIGIRSLLLGVQSRLFAGFATINGRKSKALCLINCGELDEPFAGA